MFLRFNFMLNGYRIYPVCTICPVGANIVRPQTDNDRHIFIGKPFTPVGEAIGLLRYG